MFDSGSLKTALQAISLGEAESRHLPLSLVFACLALILAPPRLAALDALQVRQPEAHIADFFDRLNAYM